MSSATPSTRRIRVALERQGQDVAKILDRYGAKNLRIFGSVARGDAREDSDLDVLVELSPHRGNELLRVAGLAEELSELLGIRVDVVAPSLMRTEVSRTALADAVDL